MTTPGKMRLQKFLSDAGAASRRKAEAMILEGGVLVNDRIVSTLPAFVDPHTDKVVVRGSVVRLDPPLYFMLNKPKNVVCTSGQKKGRLRVVDLLPPMEVKVNPVGRLDPEATGLVLLTNDGDLAQRVAHPRYEVPKRYRVEIRSQVGEDLLVKLRRGVYLSDGKAFAVQAELDHAGVDKSVILVTVYDTYPRQVQRLFARFGHEVKSIQRIAIGPLQLRALPVGGVRELTHTERTILTEAVAKTRRTKLKVARGLERAPSRGVARGVARSSGTQLVRDAGARRPSAPLDRDRRGSTCPQRKKLAAKAAPARRLVTGE